MTKVIRIDATPRQRKVAAYYHCGDQSCMVTLFILALVFGVSGLVIGFTYPPAFLALIVTVFVYNLNNKAEDTARKVGPPGANSRDATNIYNRLNSIYKMPAEPLVKKIYEVEDYAMTHCGGLSYKDDNAVAIRKRMDMLMALEDKQKSEIVGPIVNDETDLTAARMTLGVDT